MISVAAARVYACADIDLAAGNARRRFITDVPGQEAVYITKLEQAKAYAAAHALNPAALVPPYIAAEAAAMGWTAIDTASNVIGLATLWNDQIGPAIEAARLGGKAAAMAAAGIDDDATRAAIEAVRLQTIATLDGIGT